MKKLYITILTLFMISFLASCDLDDVGLNGENFFYKKIDEESIAVGNVIETPENRAVFIPYMIDGYSVSKLGFDSGLGFGGNGYLSQKSDEMMFTRCYIPNSVNDVMAGYFKFLNHTKIFYSGKAFDLECFNNLREENKLYVLPTEYASFCEVYEQKWHESIYKANVIYNLNSDSFEDEVYYLDYFNNNELITYIPPVPTTDNFNFDGWYTDSECTNKWDFLNNKILLEDNNDTMILYAKWINE